MRKGILLFLIPAVIPTVIVAGAFPAQAQQMGELQEPVIIAQATDPAAIAEEFVNRLGQQQFAAAVQDYDTPAQDVTTQTLQLSWNDIVAESGPFQGVELAQLVSQEGSESIVRVVCKFGQGNRELFVQLSGSEVASFSAVD